MIGVELTNEDDSPLAVEKVGQVFEDMKDQGILVGKGGLHGNCLRIKPPMCITKENAEQTVDALAKALKKIV